MRRALVALFCASAAPAPADPAAPPDRGVATVIWENDLFAGEDKKYTNGAFLRWTAPRGALHGWGDALRGALGAFTPAQEWRVGYGLGHFFFTASDITDPDPPLDDRPYAGALLATASIYADAGDRLDVLALDVGIVGPSARAEEVQAFVHTHFIGEDPEGWDTQLRDEVTFRVLYEQTRRVSGRTDLFGPTLEVDALPRASAALGTLEISAGAGAMLRIGQGLRGDYGPLRVRRSVAGPSMAEAGGGWQAYVSADALAVGRNLFLDGNTFQDSRSVDPEPLVGEFQIGAVYAWDGVSVGYTHVFRSPEFTSQDDWTAFGSLTLQFRF